MVKYEGEKACSDCVQAFAENWSAPLLALRTPVSEADLWTTIVILLALSISIKLIENDKNRQN